MGPPGSLGGTPKVGPGRRRDKQWSANAHPLQSDRGPSTASPNSMRRKPSHPDAEGIADDGGNKNGEHRRPAAKVTKIHRINTVGAAQRPARNKQGRERKPCALSGGLGVTCDGFIFRTRPSLIAKFRSCWSIWLVP